MVQTRGRATAAARDQGGRTRSGQIPQSRIDAQLKTPLKSKDVQLRSVAPNARKQEAKRRLKDVEEPAGRPGTNLCPYTGEMKADYQTGKRPWAFTKKKLGSKTARRICKPVAKEAWSDPEFLAEQKRVCGDREYVYPYTRGGKKVQGHCRKLSGPQRQSMEIAAAKQARKKQERELAKLVRDRDKTVAGSKEYQQLNRQIKELREQLKPKREPILEEPDDIDQYDFRVVRPNNQPRPSRRPPPSRPSTSTRRTPSTITPSMQEYIDSLPRGERGLANNVMTAYRNFGGLEPSQAIVKFKQRKFRCCADCFLKNNE